MKFRVTVKKADGSAEKRVIEAASRFAVYDQVEKEGGTVSALAQGGGFALPSWLDITFGTGVKETELIIMTKNLSAMLSAGLSLSRALSVLERQSGNKRLKAILADVEESVKQGSSFNEALRKHRKLFSELFISMVKAGEESGGLAPALAVVALQMERGNALIRKVKGAMIYPAIVVSAILVVGVLMMIFVVPTLTATFVSLKVKVPLATRIITDVSNFMVAHVALVLGGLAFLGAGLVLFVRSRPGKKAVLALALYVPVVGELVRETFAARAARTLSSLLSSGVPVVEALAIASEVVGENVFGRVVGEAKDAVEKGQPMSSAFAAHPKLYPVLMSDMAAVGEETGSVADMLKKIAEFYEEDVEERTKDLSTIIEPVLMLFIGAAVGVFAVSMIAPIYSLSSAIG
ncbi:MAG TPA: type II secretion system F family protein [Candidatus Paceibacterota bacterium]|nr:type II secretion system F family protein [Candidatus Paceibacterota bacterium]